LLQVRVDGVEDDVAAQANLITQLSSNIGEVSANATFRMGTYAAPSGWNSRIGMEVRGGTNDSYKSAGLFLDVTSTQARIALIAEQIVFSNGTEFFKPFVIQNNVMYGEGFVMDWAKIVNVQIGTAQIGDAAITSAKIGNLQVKTSNLDFGSVTQVFNASGSSPNPGNQNTPACSLLTINPQGNTCLITFGWSITWTSSSNSSVTISLINVTTGVTVASAQSPSSNGATFSDYITMIDTSAVSGNNNYELRYAGTGIPIVSAFSGTIRALVWKR